MGKTDSAPSPVSSKRILMVSANYLPEVFGGAEQQCQKLSRRLVEAGNEVTVLTSRQNRALPRDEILDGVRIHRIATRGNPQQGGPAILSTVWWIIRTFQWIRKNRINFDVIHMHQAKINAFAGVFSARLFNLPGLVKPGAGASQFDLHSLERKRIFYGKWMAAYVKKHTDQFVAISSDIADDLRCLGIGDDRIKQIPNGVESDRGLPDEATRRKLRDDLDLPQGGRILISAGRLERQKSVDVTIKAFASIIQNGMPESGHSPYLVILGDGALRLELEDLARELGIFDQVSFRGYVANVDEYLVAGDIFLLPSIAEGMSNALLEAMSVGMVSIASQVSGNPDIIDDRENGFLCEGNPDDVVTCINEALNMEPAQFDQIRFNAYDTIVSKFRMSVISEHYMNCYEQLCLRKGRA